MKKLLILSLLSFFLLFLPLTLFAEMLRISIKYTKGTERAEQNGIEITDGYWKLPVLTPPPTPEKKKYAIIIDGYNMAKPVTEGLDIVGVAFTKNDVLLPLDGALMIENKENFKRTLSVLQEENNEQISLTVPPNSSVEHQFTSAGNYTIIDIDFPWNTVFIKVLKTSYLLFVNEGANKIDIPDIAPGTYTIRIYYGTKWIYQEDFTIVFNATQNLAYNIENGALTSINPSSTSITK